METTEILFIEDNDNDIQLTLRALRKRNLTNQIHIIKDGEEALEYIFSMGKYSGRDITVKPKLILLDLKLPKVDGLEILKQVKSDERTKSIPVVMLTSSREENDMIQSYNYGVNSYIVKPINFNKFSEAVASLGLYWLLLNESI
jgi:CheY-like chemotaxis protein